MTFQSLRMSQGSYEARRVWKKKKENDSQLVGDILGGARELEDGEEDADKTLGSFKSKALFH